MDSANGKPIRFSIKIGIFGAVSVGKTTFLNALFAEYLSESKRKKCTLVPQVYQEIDENDKINAKLIRQNNKLKNKEVLDILEKNPNNLNINLCKPVYYEIGRIFRFFDKKKIDQNIYLDIYDLPGLDDSTNSSVYFEWINKNFYLFDIVIFMTDIEKALNQVGEINILRLIFENIKKEKNKLIFFIPLINKCDSIKLDEDNNLLFDSDELSNSEDEDKEMYEQANSILFQTMKEYELENKLVTKFIPLSAENAFIFRLLAKNPEEELDKKLMDKLGSNEYGKNKWNKMSKKQKKEALEEIIQHLKKPRDYQEIMLSTGFIHLKAIIEEIILENKSNLLNNNIINDTIFIDSVEDFNIFKEEAIALIEKSKTMNYKFNINNSKILFDTFNRLLKKYFNDKIKTINDNLSENYSFDQFVKLINNIIVLKNELISFCNIIIKYYDKEIFDSEFIDIIEYCSLLKNKISDLSTTILLKQDLNFENFHKYDHIIKLFDNIYKGSPEKFNDVVIQFIKRLRLDNNLNKFIQYKEHADIISYIIQLKIVPIDLLLDLILDKLKYILNDNKSHFQINTYIYLVNLDIHLKDKSHKNIEINNKLIRLRESVAYLLNNCFRGAFILTDNIDYNNVIIDFEKLIIDALNLK